MKEGGIVAKGTDDNRNPRRCLAVLKYVHMCFLTKLFLISPPGKVRHTEKRLMGVLVC